VLFTSDKGSPAVFFIGESLPHDYIKYVIEIGEYPREERGQDY
jgi:hypothetical protein